MRSLDRDLNPGHSEFNVFVNQYEQHNNSWANACLFSYQLRMPLLLLLT
jgi:hypothetical protein